MKKIFFLLLLPLGVFAQNLQLDPTFGEEGLSYATWEGVNLNESFLFGATLDPTGQAILGGNLPSNNGTQLKLVRFSNHGAIDNNFGNDSGQAVFPSFAFTGIGSILVSESNQLFIPCRGINPVSQLLNLDETGYPDYLFGNSGAATFTISGKPTSQQVLETSSGEIFLTGSIEQQINQEAGLYVANFFSNGSLNNMYGNDGYIIHPMPGLINRVTGLYPSTENGLIIPANITISSPEGTTQKVFGVKLQSDGNLDLNYGVDGLKNLFPELDEVVIMNSNCQSDGKIILCGKAIIGNEEFRLLARLTQSGNLDSGFADSGVYLNSEEIDSSDRFIDVTILPSGNILCLGNKINSGVYISMFSSKGIIDDENSFDFIITNNPSNDQVHKGLFIESTPYGKIYIMGEERDNLYPGASVFCARLIPIQTVNTKEPSQNLLIKSYPNPCSDFLNLEFSSRQSGTSQIKIYSLEGRLVYLSIPTEIKAGPNTITLDIPNQVTSGFYFLIMETGENLYQQKIEIINQ